MITRRTINFIAVLALAAAPLAGQQEHEHGEQAGQHEMQGGMQGMMGMQEMMGGGMGMDMMSMMATMRTTPGMLLKKADELGLDETQRSTLAEMNERFQGEHRQHMEAAKSLRETADEALKGDSPDWETYQATLLDAGNHMTLAHVSMTRASFEAKALLTPEQLELVGHDMDSSMKSGMEGHMDGMVEGMGKKGGSSGMRHRR
jgi:Spy/CpxP family protein refolding chaperone